MEFMSTHLAFTWGAEGYGLPLGPEAFSGERDNHQGQENNERTAKSNTV